MTWLRGFGILCYPIHYKNVTFFRAKLKENLHCILQFMKGFSKKVEIQKGKKKHD